LEITTHPLENCQVRLTVGIEQARVNQALRHAAREVAQTIHIPGFRKGKAPYEIILQRFGETALRQQAADTMMQDVYQEALTQQGIQPYAPGALTDINLDPLTFEFTIPLPPRVDLGEYRNYRLDPPSVEVLPEEVQRVLDEIRKENVMLEPVERAIAMGDGVEISLVGKTADGGAFLEQDQMRMLLEADAAEPAPGFFEAIIGMAAGDERSFSLALPDDFPREAMRGREAEFTVHVHQVYESTYPEIDDDLARTVGNFGSLQELEAQVQEQLREGKQQQADQEYTDQVMENLLAQVQVEYPPLILDEELDAMVKDVAQAVKQQTRLSLSDYLRFRGQSEDDLRKELAPRAEANVRRALMLGEAVRQERLTVTDEEIEAYIAAIQAQLGDRAEKIVQSLRSEAGRENLESQMLAQKAVQRVCDIARGEAPALVAVEEPTAEVETETEEGEA
jgi:trigger factor